MESSVPAKRLLWEDGALVSEVVLVSKEAALERWERFARHVRRVKALRRIWNGVGGFLNQLKQARPAG